MVGVRILLAKVSRLTFRVSGAQLLKKTTNEKPEVMSTFLASNPVNMLNAKGLTPFVSHFSPPRVQSYVQSVVGRVDSAVRSIVPEPRAFVTAALGLAEFADIGLLDSYERQRSRMKSRIRQANPTLMNVASAVNTSLLRSRSFFAAAADDDDAKVDAAEADAKKTLPVIHPILDGRLKNVAQG